MSSNQFKNISISGGIGIKGKETLSHDPVITYQYISNVEPETTGIFGKTFCRSGNIICISKDDNVEIYTQTGANFSKVMTIEGIPDIDFGYSMDISGHILTIGAPGYASHKGKIFVYDILVDTWTLKNSWELTNNDSETSGRFGESVSIVDNTIAVGSPAASANKGYVTFWEFSPAASDVKYKGKIVSPSDQTGAGFGSKVQMVSGFEVLISCPMENVTQETTFTSNGAVYGFTKNEGTWIQTSRIISPVGQNNMLFGNDFSFGHDILIIGAPGKVSSGGAYLYIKKAFSYSPHGEISIVDNEMTNTDEIGYKVQVTDDAMLIASKNNHGKIYVMEIAEDDSVVPSLVPVIVGTSTSAINSGIQDITDGFVFSDQSKMIIYLKP